MDKSNAILPIVGDFPPEYRSIGEVGVYFSLYDWEDARAKYAAYGLLVDACKKSALALDAQLMAIPPDVEVTKEWMAQWKQKIDAANQTAVDALYKALLAVEEMGPLST
jgi:hypothetical protein